LQRVAKVTELDEDSIISAESLLAPDNFSELLDSAFFSDELDRLDPFDSALLSLEIASSHSSEAPAQREEEDKVSESAEETELEDERPCFSALLNATGSLFSADADDESSHAAKNASMLNATKIFFIKTPSP